MFGLTTKISSKVQCSCLASSLLRLPEMKIGFAWHFIIMQSLPQKQLSTFSSYQKFKIHYHISCFNSISHKICTWFYFAVICYYIISFFMVICDQELLKLIWSWCDLSIHILTSFRIAWLALGWLCDYPSTGKVALKDVGKIDQYQTTTSTNCLHKFLGCIVYLMMKTYSMGKYHQGLDQEPISHRIYELIIWISEENNGALTWKMIIQSGHNFAQVTTAEMSWHVQICDLIRSIES